MPVSIQTKQAFAKKEIPPVPKIDKNVVTPECVASFLFETDTTTAFEAYSQGEANHAFATAWTYVLNEKGVDYTLKLYLHVITDGGQTKVISIDPETQLWTDIVTKAKLEPNISKPWPKYPQNKS